MKRIIVLVSIVFILVSLICGCGTVREEGPSADPAASGLTESSAVESSVVPVESQGKESEAVSNDESGQGSKENYRLAKSLVHDIDGVPTKTQYVYDSKGNLINESISCNGVLTIIDYDYKGGVLISKTVAISNAYYTETDYEYDGIGNMISERATTHQIPGGPTVKETVVFTERTLDEENRVVAAKTYIDDKLSLISQISYSENNGSVTEVYAVDGSGKTNLNSRVELNGFGKIVKQEENGVVLTYLYDEHYQKKLVAIAEIDGDSKVYVYENEYDENGNLIKAHCVCEERGIEFTDEFEYQFATVFE